MLDDQLFLEMSKVLPCHRIPDLVLSLHMLRRENSCSSVFLDQAVNEAHRCKVHKVELSKEIAGVFDLPRLECCFRELLNSYLHLYQGLTLRTNLFVRCWRDSAFTNALITYRRGSFHLDDAWTSTHFVRIAYHVGGCLRFTVHSSVVVIVGISDIFKVGFRIQLEKSSEYQTHLSSSSPKVLEERTVQTTGELLEEHDNHMRRQIELIYLDKCVEALKEKNKLNISDNIFSTI